MNAIEKDWPALPLEEWEATYRTLHLWTQIVGKIRLALAAGESLVELRSLREYTRPDDFADTLSGKRV